MGVDANLYGKLLPRTVTSTMVLNIAPGVRTAALDS